MGDGNSDLKKKRVVSGMRTTHRLHIGHFFGVIRNWLKLQHEHECFFGAMDWHAMTSIYKSTFEVDGYIREVIAEWYAWGIDFEKSTVFVQSRVPEHLELFMILANLTPMGWLERVPSWKDAEIEAKQNDTHNLGRFAYPVLQSADIAMYLGDFVPIGQDQASHLEISREVIRRFNGIYKAKLPEPKPLFTDTPLVPGLDGRKMSKSYGNTIELSMEPKILEKTIMKMPTDPARVRREDKGDPDVCNVYTYHTLFSSSSDLKWVREGCTTAGIGCGDCKMRLVGNINTLCEKPRELKKELLNDHKKLDSMIIQGCDKARVEAQKTLKRVREAMKFTGGV
ncbi:MAG: tryptophan--tRNA ligase [Pseudomonadota bacterium]|nr:tryptophan--tRNA ligase [Pseudomonadota bacterium]